MASGAAGDERELRYRNKQIEFSRRWYRAHVHRAETDPDYERSGGRRGSRDGDPGHSALKFLEFVTGHRPTGSPSQRNARYTELVAEVDDDAGRFERVASWWDEKKPVFLDPVLVDRCAYGFHNPDKVPREIRKSNAEAIVAIAKHLGQALVDDLSHEVNRPLSATEPPLYWIRKTKSPRPDLWVGWWVKGLRGLGLRLWINHKGAALGLYPGRVRKGWVRAAASVVDADEASGLRLMSARRAGQGRGDDVGFRGGDRGSFIYGRWYESGQLADIDLRAEAIDLASAARPVLDALIRRARGEDANGPPPSHDPLADAVAEFYRDTAYPTAHDDKRKAQRHRLVEMLRPDNLAISDRAELRKIWTNAYGSPGVQSILGRSVIDADEVEYERILQTFEYVCWGTEADADRIDKALGDADYKVRGLAESGILKLLAVCHPDRYLCVYPYSGKQGKLRMLRALDLPEPPVEATSGRKHVESNDRLWERLEPFFPGDPWGMMRFLYWYLDRSQDAGVDPLRSAAEDLLVKRSFLDDIVELLVDKGPSDSVRTSLVPARRSWLRGWPRLWRLNLRIVILGPVPSIYLLRGLLRGLQTGGGTGWTDRLPADPRSLGAHGRTSRGVSAATPSDGHRRNQPGQPAQGPGGVAVPARVPGQVDLDPVSDPTGSSSCRSHCGSSAL